MSNNTNTNSTYDYTSIARLAFSQEAQAEKSHNTAQQCMAYAIMAFHSDLSMNEKLPTLAACYNAGEARNLFMEHAEKAFLGPRPKQQPGEKSQGIDRLIRQWNARRAEIVNGLTFAVELQALGVQPHNFVMRNKTTGLFCIPVSMLAPSDFPLSPRKKVDGDVTDAYDIDIDGETYYFANEKGDTRAVRASVASLRAAYLAKATALAAMAKATGVATTDIALPVRVKSNAGRKGKTSQTTTTTTTASATIPTADASSLSFNQLVTELAGIIRDGGKDLGVDELVKLSDLPLNVRNGLSVIAQFYNECFERDNMKPVAEKKAKAA